MRFDIPAQPVPDAVRTFIKQADVQVTYRYDDLKASRANEVRGELEPEAGLVKLVEGTGIEVSKTTDSSFALKRNAVAPASGTVRGTVVKPEIGSSADIRILVRESGQQAVTDRRGEFVFANVEAGTYTLIASAEGLQTMHITDVTVRAGRELTLSRETMRKASDVTELDPFVVRGRADEVTELDKYVVEGTKQKPFTAGNMDIPRTINDVQPYYIFDAKTIDSSGALNVGDFLKQRLTMNTEALSSGQRSGASSFGNTSSIDLRGLGTDKTLILVNGRRMAGTLGGDRQPDLNGIPMAEIERIEILPSSASGIYGGSAIGGVVNVILKRNFSGGEIRVGYDNTFDTDSPRRNVNFSYGFTLEGGRTSVKFSAAWADEKPMLLQDRRSLVDSGLLQKRTNDPNNFYGNTAFLGSLPNIIATSAAVTSLTLKDGTSLNSRITHIPAGTSPDTSAAALAAGLLANAGTWNLELPPATQSPTGLKQAFGATPENKSFAASVRRQMWGPLELFADVAHRENNTKSIYNPYYSNRQIAATAPNNPFNEAITIMYPVDSDIPASSQSTTRSFTLGSVARLPFDWDAELDYTWSESVYDYDSYYYDYTPNYYAVLNGEINPLFDTLMYPIDESAYLQHRLNKSKSRLHSFAARGAGALPRLPWGQPSLAVGLEHRIGVKPETVNDTLFPISYGGSRQTTEFRREQKILSGYAELQLPLVQKDWLPLVHAFELQASGRTERYTVDTGTNSKTVWYERVPVLTEYASPTLNGQPYFSTASYDSTNYTVGFKYQPGKEVVVRLSRASAFLPPTPVQLIKNPQQSTNRVNVYDPVTNTANVPVYTLSGGNPDLLPQDAKSFNAGVIWEPTWKPVKGLRVNVEYYSIDQFNFITTLGAQGIVDQESLYPGRVVRDPSGTITLVDNSMVNLYHRETAGWDLSLDYTRRTNLGLFNLRFVESIITALKSQYSLSQPQFDAVGFPSENGAAKYKSNVSLNWEWRRWSAGWTARYFSSYNQYGVVGGPNATQRAATGTTPAGRLPVTTYTLPQGSDTIPSQMYHDLFVGYSFPERPSGSDSRMAKLGAKVLSGLSVQLGVRNVFNTLPPYDVYYGSNYYISPYGDTRLQSHWLNVKKAF